MTTATAVRATTFREAFREAIRDALIRDERVLPHGRGRRPLRRLLRRSARGCSRSSGPSGSATRPLSESGFVGAGIGAAMDGMRPIVEVMTVNFSLLALDQIMNNAATMLHMSGGQINVPLVIRMTTGAGRQLAAQHSHSLEGWFAHIPGIRVLAPATLEDARGMLWTALQDPDPVLIFENGAMYPVSGDLAASAGAVEIDHAAVRRAGEDVSLITYGGSLPRAMLAAEALEEEGISAEVLDLRTLRPLDTAAVLATVGRTHRAVVVDEGWRSGSLAAEVSARIMEGAFYELEAPVARVCSAEVPIPFAQHMEQAALPQPETIAGTARGLVRGHG